MIFTFRNNKIKFFLFGLFIIFLFIFFSCFKSYDKVVFSNSFVRGSNISIVPIDYSTDIVYNDDMVYGEEKITVNGVMGYALAGSDTVIAPPINEVKEIGRGPLSISYGSTTGYGANCVGCSGNVACRTSYGTHNLISNGVFYDDLKYGSVRIIAADHSVFSCGTIIEVDNGVMEPFMAIVLDTGGAMRSASENGNILIDIAFSYEDSDGIFSATNRSGNVKFKVYRNGW